MAKFKNTLKQGSVRYIVFREGEDWYAAGLEFNIIESGSTPQEALFLLFDALQGYVETAQRMKSRPHALNQKTDPEYENLWVKLNSKKEVPSNSPIKEIFTLGQVALA